MMKKAGKQISISYKVYGVVILLALAASVSFRNAGETRTGTQQSSTVDGKLIKRKESSSGSIASGTERDDFQLAFRESLGFFDDIPAVNWRRMKDISKGRIHHSEVLRRSADTRSRAEIIAENPKIYYASNWDPDFSCQFEDSIGQTESDGHKWVCDPHRLADKEDCLIYSIGSNGVFDFELDLQRRLPNCEIHIFDPTDYSRGMWKSGLNGTNYHAWGFESSYGKPVPVSKKNEGLRFLSFPESMKLLGHTGRRIDILKIDCEGCEWSTHKDILDQNIRQILVEVHGVHKMTEQFFQDLYDEGYVIFHKEPNAYSPQACLEFAFLKLAKEYFQ